MVKNEDKCLSNFFDFWGNTNSLDVKGTNKISIKRDREVDGELVFNEKSKAYIAY